MNPSEAIVVAIGADAHILKWPFDHQGAERLIRLSSSPVCEKVFLPA